MTCLFLCFRVTRVPGLWPYSAKITLEHLVTKSTGLKCQQLYSSPQVSQGLLITTHPSEHYLQSMLQMILSFGFPASWFVWNLQSPSKGSRNYCGSLSGAPIWFHHKTVQIVAHVKLTVSPLWLSIFFFSF